MKDKIIKFVITVTIIVIFLAVTIIGVTQVTSLTPKRVFEKSVQSIVELKAVSEGVGESYGTAVCINSDDYLVTNAHVVTYKQMGDDVYAIGNGSNYGLALTHGIISIPKINVEYENITREVIQSDITISAGNSGGALLDDKGEFIGMTSFRTKDNQGNVVYGLVYSIPVNIIVDYINVNKGKLIEI